MSAQGKGRGETRVRWLSGHRPGCYSLQNFTEGRWSTVWAFMFEVVYRDSLGRENFQGTSRRWWKVKCNDPECPAQILVAEDSILEGLPCADWLVGA